MPEIGRERYDAYITSIAWAKRRARLFVIRGRSCEHCGDTRKIHVHHATYERFGDELDEDLVILCELHHAKLHDYQRKTGLPLPVATERFMSRPPKSRPRRGKKSKSRQSYAPAQSHTPEGWLPRNKRPGYVSDPIAERRGITSLPGPGQHGGKGGNREGVAP